MIEQITARHFKKLESKLLELNLPQLAYIAISKEFRYLEDDFKKAFSFVGKDLDEFMKNMK